MSTMNTIPATSETHKVPVGSVLGRHVIIELHGCVAGMLNQEEVLRPSLIEAAEQAGATVVESVFHRFSPHGLSGVVVIAESHITVHTWPEHSYAAVDVFTCGEPGLADRIRDQLVERFKADNVYCRSLERGLPV